MPRRIDLYGERRRYSLRSTWVLIPALALWVVLALAFPSIDPEPRGEWYARRRMGTDRTFERPWCPLCGAVEDHVVDHPAASGAAGVAQLVLFATPFAVTAGLLQRAGSSEGIRRRQRDIEAERIERSLRRSGHLRDDDHDDD